MSHNNDQQILTDRELDAVSGGLSSAAAGNGASIRKPRPRPRPNGSINTI